MQKCLVKMISALERMLHYLLFNISWFLKCKDQYFITDFHIFSLKIRVWNNGKTLNSIKDFQKVAKINEDKVKSF